MARTLFKLVIPLNKKRGGKCLQKLSEPVIRMIKMIKDDEREHDNSFANCCQPVCILSENRELGKGKRTPFQSFEKDW